MPPALTSARDAPGRCGRGGRLVRALPFDATARRRRPARPRQRRRGQRRAAEGRAAGRRRPSTRSPTRVAAARACRRLVVDCLRALPVAACCAAARARCSLIAGRCAAARLAAAPRAGRRPSLVALGVGSRARALDAAIAPPTRCARTTRRRRRSTRCRASPDFVIAEPGARVRPTLGGDRQRRGGRASRRAARLVRARPRRAPRPAPCRAPRSTLAGASPTRRRRRSTRRVTIPRRVLARHRAARRASRDELGERFGEVDGLSGDRPADVRAARRTSRPSCSCPTST